MKSIRCTAGLSVTDLSNRRCCERGVTGIIAEAESLNLEKIVCPCTGCYRALVSAADSRMQVVIIPEILLQCLEASA